LDGGELRIGRMRTDRFREKRPFAIVVPADARGLPWERNVPAFMHFSTRELPAAERISFLARGVRPADLPGRDRAPPCLSCRGLGLPGFTAYALDLRIERAYKMLTDMRYASWPISAIAYEAGFGDLSHFNRSFRRRFSAPPSDIRGAFRYRNSRPDSEHSYSGPQRTRLRLEHATLSTADFACRRQ
jgi:AraC-like DNA-binding protein